MMAATSGRDDPAVAARDPEHPRPQLRRGSWTSLDGSWELALDPDAALSDPATVDYDRMIVVPFAPETPASGVGFDGFLRRVWYRRSVTAPARSPGERLLLHFGAVDRTATVWVDGHRVGAHVGGFTPFAVDVTDAVSGPDFELVVRADDEPRSLTVPRGKQVWTEEPNLIWYPRTTGIWQTVWMEIVPAARVGGLRWRADPMTMTVDLTVEAEGAVADGDTLHVVLQHGARVLVDDESVVTDVVDGRVSVTRSYRVGTPGVDDASDLVWRPRHPVLIDARVEYRGAAGVDRVESYTALRSVGLERGRFVLNGRPLKLRLALDQGYWPASGMTAPSVGHLRRDVELVKELGLHGVRKHQKVEDPRWLALCDELGVLVWAEMPSAFAWSPDLPATLAAEWSEVVRRDRNHPCVVAWVPVNESWGLHDLLGDHSHRAALVALTALTRALDPDRPVSANDGWETLGGDILGIHDYDQDGTTLATRYRDAAAVDAVIAGPGPSRRVLTADGTGRDGRAVVVSEMGGCTLEADPAGTFSYGNLTSEDDYLARVRSLCRAVLASDALSGYCWTQLTDTYQERNGLVRADRSPKVDPEALRAALRGR